VRESFADQGIILDEVQRSPDEGNPLRLILGPAVGSTNCDEEEVRVNLFGREAEVEAHLRREGLPIGESRYVLDGDVGFVRGNVVVAVRRDSDCFPERAVLSALEGLR
jgi:hypothetical protein